MGDERGGWCRARCRELRWLACVAILAQPAVGFRVIAPSVASRVGLARRGPRPLKSLVDVSDLVLSSASLPAKVDLTGLPDWVQRNLEDSGINVITSDKANQLFVSQQFALIFLGSYVSRLGNRNFEQRRSEQIREERRKRSGLGRPTLDDVKPDDDWLEKD